MDHNLPLAGTVWDRYYCVCGDDSVAGRVDGLLNVSLGQTVQTWFASTRSGDDGEMLPPQLPMSQAGVGGGLAPASIHQLLRQQQQHVAARDLSMLLPRRLVCLYY